MKKFGIKNIESIKIIDQRTGEVIDEFDANGIRIKREVENLEYYYKDEKIKTEEITHTDTIILD